MFGVASALGSSRHAKRGGHARRACRGVARGSQQRPGMVKRGCAAFAMAMVSVAGIAVARAEPPPSGPLAGPPSGPPARHWYGRELILGDLVGIAVIGVGEASGGPVGAAAGAVVAVVGVPAIHGLHGNAGRMLVSIALRQGLLLGGAYLGAHGACRGATNEDSPCGFQGAVRGALLGYLTAAVIDAAVLAYEPAQPAPGPTLAPTVSVAPGQIDLGIAGTF